MMVRVEVSPWTLEASTTTIGAANTGPQWARTW